MRRAARRDQNEPAIIKALRDAGATVEQWDKVDLVVGFRGRNYLLEVKHPDRTKAHVERLARQADWRRAWAGQACVVTSPTEALQAIYR
jgi:hypothetical protein